MSKDKLTEQDVADSHAMMRELQSRFPGWDIWCWWSRADRKLGWHARLDPALKADSPEELVLLMQRHDELRLPPCPRTSSSLTAYAARCNASIPTG